MTVSRSSAPSTTFTFLESDEFADQLKQSIGQRAPSGPALQRFRFSLVNSSFASVHMSFMSIVAPMLASHLHLKSKNANLRTTRDFLLPKLISGEVSVEAADETAAELMETDCMSYSTPTPKSRNRTADDSSLR